MIISISGSEGSGKSTIAKMLATKLGRAHYSIGNIWRQKAKEKGLLLSEYQKLAENDISLDLEVDEYQKKLGETLDNFVIEGRTSWHFIPNSFKFFLDVSLEESAKRIFKELQKSDARNEDKNLKTVEDVIKSLEVRRQSNILRYRKYFNIDVYDKKNYDFILDTTNLDVETVFKKVWQIVEERIEANK